MAASPLYPLAALLGGAVLVPFASYVGRLAGIRKLEDAVAIASISIALLLVTSMAEAPRAVYTFFGFAPPLGIELLMDKLNVYMAMIFCLIGLAVSVFSVRYMEVDTGLDKYYSLLLTLVAGMIGVAFSNDLFNLYVFWEMMCISSYSLVAFRNYRWEPVEAGFKYLVMSTLGSLVALYAMSLLYGVAGTLNIAKLYSIINSSAGTSPTLYLPLALFFAGFGVTAAIVPFHAWLPDAHPAAPASISAMLSGVVIKTGAYALFKSTFLVFNPTNFSYGVLFIVFGVITMTAANVWALMQRDIKRLLAYSSIANMGYIVTGLGIGAYLLHSHPESAWLASMAFLGAFIHVLNHAIGKGLLFLCTGSFAHEARTRDLRILEGIGRRMPWSGGSFAIGLLNLAGIPPLIGFWGKFYIAIAGLGILWDNFMKISTLIFILNSIFAAAYYLWLLQRIMFSRPTPRAEEAREAPLLMVLPVVTLAALCIFLTFLIGPISGFIGEASKVLVKG